MQHPRITAGGLLSILLGVAGGAAADSWTCHKAGLTRQVVVYYPDEPAPLPCQVFYSKPKENVVPRALWEAQNVEGYCERQAAAFVAKLGAWGWRCALDPVDDGSRGQTTRESRPPDR